MYFWAVAKYAKLVLQSLIDADLQMINVIRTKNQKSRKKSNGHRINISAYSLAVAKCAKRVLVLQSLIDVVSQMINVLQFEFWQRMQNKAESRKLCRMMAKKEHSVHMKRSAKFKSIFFSSCQPVRNLSKFEFWQIWKQYWEVLIDFHALTFREKRLLSLALLYYILKLKDTFLNFIM